MKQVTIAILLLLFGWELKAQDVKFQASAPAVVEVGEQFQLTYTVNQNASSLKVPTFDNFNFLGGPTQYQNSSSQWVNGKSSRVFEMGFTYYLQATRIGTFTIAPAQATVNGKTVMSNPVKIEVVNGSKPATTNSNQQSTTQQKPDDFSNEDLFVRLLLDKKISYQGEAITATVKIYSRVRLSQISNAIPPSFAGFFKDDVEVPQLNSLQRENVEGQAYGTGVIQKFIIYPQKTGDLVIDPYKLDCVVQREVKGRSGGFFDDFFGPSLEDVQRSIASKPLHITVKPLPEPKPNGFNGAVGDYTMKVTADKNQLKENDALSMRIELEGTGNLKLLESPRISFPPDFENYDPKITTNIAKSGNSGSRLFEYLVIPRHVGNFRISPVEFSFFNPNTGNYKTLTSADFHINVLKGDSTATSGLVTGLSKEEVKFVGNDIRFIKTGNIVLKPVGVTLAASLYYYLFFPVLLLLFVVLVILRRKQIRDNADKALVRNRKANKIARIRLQNAEKFLAAANQEAFYDEMIRALYGYLSDKLRIPLAELSLANSIEELGKRNVSAELVSALAEMVDKCQYARYAPAAGSSSMKEDFGQAATIIRKLEQNLR